MTICDNNSIFTPSSSLNISSASKCLINLTHEIAKTMKFITIINCNITKTDGYTIMTNVINILQQNVEKTSFSLAITNGTQNKMNTVDICVKRCDLKEPKDRIYKNYYRNLRLTHIYLMFIDNLQDFSDNLEKLEFLSSYNISAEFILFYTNPPNNTVNTWTMAYKILEIAYNQSKYSATLLIPSEKDVFELYVFDLFAKEAKYCGRQPILRLLNTCSRGEFLMDVYRHTTNYAKLNCSIRTEVMYLPPFVISATEGIEILILEELQKQLNITFEIFYHNATLKWGSVQNDGNWSGILYNLLVDRFRIGIGAVEMREDRLFEFDFSLNYFSEKMYWIVPRAKRVGDWTLVLFVFHWLFLVVLLGLLMVISVIVWIASNIIHFNGNDTHWKTLGAAILLSVQITLSASVGKHPSLFTNRLAFISYTLFMVIIGGLYQSALIDVLTHPKYEHQMSTYQEIVESPLPIGGRAYVKQFFEDPKYDAELVVYNKYNCLTKDATMDFWRDMVANGKAISILGKQYLMYYYKKPELTNPDGTSKVYYLENEAFVNTYQIIFSKNFLLKKYFDDVIEKLVLAGLIEKWKDFYIYQYNSRERKSINMNLQSNIVLTLNHLQGAFLIMIFGHVLAICVFAIEVFIWN